jgi:hypothetical protein
LVFRLVYSTLVNKFIFFEEFLFCQFKYHNTYEDPDLADTPIVATHARRDGLADRLEFEKMFQVHLRKTLRVGI